MIRLYKSEQVDNENVMIEIADGVTQFIGATGNINVGATGATITGNCTITAKGTPIS